MLYKDDETLPAGASPSHPARLGEFRLERELGRGGMGVVYLAEQEKLGRRVALKVLPLLAAASPVAAERFLREASLVARLEHENIVRVYAMGQEQGCLYYAMELVEGESLRDRIGRGTLPPREAVELARAVASALGCAHRAGIVHRDVKPANILLDRAGVPHLADFGLAYGQDSSSLTLSGELLGTPAYMSPEQAEAKQDVDARADIYALGAVLYDALTGVPPCGLHTDLVAQLVAVRLLDPVAPSRLNPRVPRDLDVVVMRCLEKDRGRRYPTAASFAEDLDRFLGGEAILARPPSVAWRLKRFASRHWAAVVVGAAVFAVSLGAAVFWATRPGHLTLRVQPPDARVRIDGGPAVRADAAERLQLDAGTHDVCVSREGYVPVEFPYVVARAESAVVPVNLERVRERLRIATDPPDCSVSFRPSEGAPFRRLSEVDEKIATDRYEVVVEKEGHHRARLTLDLRAGEPVDLRVTLPSAVLWTRRFPQPCSPLSAPLSPGGPPVLAVVCQSGEVEFLRARDGTSLGKAQTTAALAEPLVVDIEPDGTPELLTIDPAGGLRLVRWGSGEEVWTQAAPRVGRIGAYPASFSAAGGATPELRLAYEDAVEVVDLRTGVGVGQFAVEGEYFQVVLSDEPRRCAVHDRTSLSVVEGLPTELAEPACWVERLETPRVAWERFFLAAFDFDGDGAREVVVRCHDGSIHVYRTGPLKRIWQTPPNDYKDGHFATARLRAGETGCLVAMVATDQQAGSASRQAGSASRQAGSASQQAGVASRVEVREADGRVRASWSLPASPLGSFMLADMDADGARDMVYVSGNDLYVIDLSTGRPLAEVPFARPTSARFALADVDEDGLLDAAVSLSDGTLQLVPGRKVLWSWSTGHSVRRSPRLVDLTGDGTPEVVFSSLDSHAYALEGRSGRLLWKAPIGGQAATRPAVAGGDLVLAAWGGRAARVRGRTGAEVWSYVPQVDGWSVNFHASPLVADIDGDGRLEVVLADWRTDPDEKKDPSGAIHCLDAETGRVNWVKELSGPFASAPAFAVPGEVVAGDTGGTLFCLGADGAVKWQEAHAGQFLADPRPAPGEDGTLVWIVSGTGEVLETRGGEAGSKASSEFPRALHVEWGTAAGKPIRVVAARKDVSALDPSSGTLHWRTQTQSIVMASPLAVDLEADGTTEVFVAEQEGRVSCLEGTTGEVRWTWEAGSPIEAWPIAADMDGDGRPEVILATSDGRVVVLNARGRRWSGEWLTGWGDRFRTCAPDSVGPR